MYLQIITKFSLISISITLGLLHTSTIVQAQVFMPGASSMPGSSPSPMPGASSMPGSSPMPGAPSSPPSPGQISLPTIVTPTPPQIQDATAPVQPAPNNPDATVATASIIKVGCEGLQTAVQKGERQAFLFNWKTSYFGAEYTPEKRCQIVSQRLQSAADRNSGTLKGLELKSGNLNGQTVICVIQSGENRCTDRNLLFTLNPENAKNPQAVIAKILTFASSGSSTINESARSQPSSDLGNWERRAFPESKKSTTPNQNYNSGF